jgi:hypothetical protein
MEALHMRRLTYFTLALVLVGLSGASLADEVVTFTNGTSMPVRSHYVEDGMLHVDLGGNAFLAFPEDMVESIEVDGEIHLPPSDPMLRSGGGKLMLAAGGERGSNDAPAVAGMQRPNRPGNDRAGASGNTQDPQLRPMASNTHTGISQLSAAGRVGGNVKAVGQDSPQQLLPGGDPQRANIKKITTGPGGAMRPRGSRMAQK